MSMQVQNPAGAFGETSDVDNQFKQTALLKNTGAVAIAKGDAVASKYTASGTLNECEAWDTDASGQNANMGIGVADQAIPVNGVGKVTVLGYSRVNVAANTAAKGNQAVGSTVAGVVTPTVADATTVIGTSLGILLGVKDAANLAPIWVCPR